MTKAYKYNDIPPLGLSLAIMNMSVLVMIFRTLQIPVSEAINYIQLMFLAHVAATFI
jgi:hypothetical protein